MFCPNCGNRMEDDAKFCSACGAGMAEETMRSVPAHKKAAGRTGVKLPVIQNKGKAVRLCAAVLVLVVVIAAAVTVFGSNYRKPLDDTIKLLNAQEYDVRKYMKAMAPKCVAEGINDMLELLKDVDGYSGQEDAAKESLKSQFFYLARQYGDHLKFSYEILGTRELDQRELNDARISYQNVRDDLREMKAGGSAYYLIDKALSSSKMKKYDRMIEKLDDGLKDIEITKGYDLDIDFTMKGKAAENTYRITVRVVKANGTWSFDLTNMENWIDRMW